MTQQNDYNNPTSPATSAYGTTSGDGGSYRDSGTRHTTEVTAAINNTPTDRVRWPAIFAGLFAAVSTLALLTLLGAAIGLSSYDAGDSSKAFAIGTGIWGAISVLIAFFIGGLLAARTSALPGRDVGMLNGAMVWAVAIPLLAWLAASMVGSAARAAGSALSTTATAASNVAAAAPEAAREYDRQSTENPELAEEAERQAEQTTQAVQQQARELRQSIADVEVEDVERGAERAADASRGPVWGTLISMLLALGAATAGGAVGARDTHDDHRADHRRGTTA